MSQLDFVDFLVSPDQNQNLLLFINDVEDALDNSGGWHLQEFCQLVNGVAAWSSNLFHRLQFFRLLLEGINADGHFQVSGVGTGSVGCNSVFTNSGRCLELNRVLAPHSPGVSDNWPDFNACALEDLEVGCLFIIKLLVQLFLAGREAVAVQHYKFSAPEKTETWPVFIPELSLNLVKVQGHLLVRLEALSHHVSEGFFVGWPQQHFPAMPVLQTEHFRAILWQTA